MSTITQDQQQKIADYLATHVLPAGIGTEESACSIAAINLALTGNLTNSIPACMSPVIGSWIIGVQDAMPANMRNSPEWKRLLPLAAGTGRDHEAARLAIIHDWIWGTVLPTLQEMADAKGLGAAWMTMTIKRTPAAAWAAAAAWVAAAEEAAAAEAWAKFDPCALLEKLIHVGETL